MTFPLGRSDCRRRSRGPARNRLGRTRRRRRITSRERPRIRYPVVNNRVCGLTVITIITIITTSVETNHRSNPSRILTVGSENIRVLIIMPSTCRSPSRFFFLVCGRATTTTTCIRAVSLHTPCGRSNTRARPR